MTIISVAKPPALLGADVRGAFRTAQRRRLRVQRLQRDERDAELQRRASAAEADDVSVADRVRANWQSSVGTGGVDWSF